MSFYKKLRTARARATSYQMVSDFEKEYNGTVQQLRTDVANGELTRQQAIQQIKSLYGDKGDRYAADILDGR